MLKTLRTFSVVALCLTVIAIMISTSLHSPAYAQNATAAPTSSGTSSAPPVKVLFSDDFSTRANRWNTFDLGKAKVDFDESATPTVLTFQAQPDNYPLWTYPDNALKLDHFDMTADLTFGKSGDDARAGIMLQYYSENAMTVLAVSPKGDVYLGNYSFGIWNDLIPPGKVIIDPTQKITLEVALLTDRTIRILVNDQPAGGTAIRNFKPTGFGLFALTGTSGGITVSFQHFVVNDI